MKKVAFLKVNDLPEIIRQIVSNAPQNRKIAAFIASVAPLCAMSSRARLQYYYDSRREGSSRTDEEHYAALEELAGDRAVEKVIVDPSAASFIECIRRHGKFRVAKADNDVISGIRQVSTALKQGRLRFHESCRDIIRGKMKSHCPCFGKQWECWRRVILMIWKM